MPVTKDQAEATLKRRQDALANFVTLLAMDARKLAEKLDGHAKEIKAATETADEPFEEAIHALENFVANIRYRRALRLAADYASSEMELLQVSGAA